MESRPATGGGGGTTGGLSQQARRDLIVIGVAALLFSLVQVALNLWERMDSFFNGIGFEIDVVVPFLIAATIGFAVYAYRRQQELRGLNAARERARVAAGQAQDQLERAQREAKQARQEAEDLQRLNRQLIDTGMSALVKVDREGNVTEVNEGMEVATGLHSSRLVGTSAFSFFGDQKKARDLFEQSLEGNAVQNERAEIVHQDGGTTAVAFNVMAQRNVNGEITGGLLLLRPREEAFTS